MRNREMATKRPSAGANQAAPQPYQRGAGYQAASGSMMSSKPLVITLCCILAIGILVVISSIGPGFEVQANTVNSLEFSKLNSSNSNERIVIQDITITNSYFLPRAYDLPRLKACLYDQDGNVKGDSIGLSYGESVQKSSPFKLGMMADVASYSRYYYLDYATASRRVEVAPGGTTKVQLLLTPKYYYDYYNRDSGYSAYDELLLIDTAKIDDPDQYSFCQDVGDDTREKAIKITLTR